MRNADCFVLQSLYESAPTVVYEALTVNTTPIVACEVAGVREQLQDGKLGMIVENSIEGLVQGMKACLENPQLLEQYRQEMKAFQNTNEASLEKIKALIINE